MRRDGQANMERQHEMCALSIPFRVPRSGWDLHTTKSDRQCASLDPLSVPAGTHTAVVWRGKDGDELTLREKLVAVLDDLVRAADEVEVVLLQKLFHNARPKGEGDAAVVLAPLLDLLLRVAPQQVAEEAWRRGWEGDGRRNGERG